jgi:hypothetical protein
MVNSIGWGEWPFSCTATFAFGAYWMACGGRKKFFMPLSGIGLSCLIHSRLFTDYVLSLVHNISNIIRL